MDWKKAFTEMKDELENQTQIIILNIFDGITEVDFHRLKNTSGFHLDNEVKDFYLQTNGLQLLYIKKNNKHFSLNDIPDNNGHFDWMWTWKDYWRVDGIINILPLQISLAGNWENMIYFDYQKSFKQNDSLSETIYDYRKRIRPFDFFSKASVISFFKESDYKTKIVMGIDDNTEFVNVKKNDFSSYLHFLLEIKASSSKRIEYIN